MIANLLPSLSRKSHQNKSILKTERTEIPMHNTQQNVSFMSQEKQTTSNFKIKLKTQTFENIESPLQRLSPQKQYRSIMQTNKKIDEVLRIFQSKVKHAHYLQQMKLIYMNKLGRLQKQIQQLQFQKKIKEMESNEKQTISQLLKKMQQYKEESDKFFVVIHQIKKKVIEMGKHIKQLEKVNDKLVKQNYELLKYQKINTAVNAQKIEDVSLKEAIAIFLNKSQNIKKNSILYMFCLQQKDKNYLQLNKQKKQCIFFENLSEFLQEMLKLSISINHNINKNISSPLLKNATYYYKKLKSLKLNKPQYNNSNKLKYFAEADSTIFKVQQLP